MSLVRLLPAWFHAIADYAVGILLVIVALAVGGSSGAVATGVVVGLTVLAVSALTKYPLGIAKVLPFTVMTLRGLLVLNTPVNAVVVLTLPFAPISATTRGTVTTKEPGV